MIEIIPFQSFHNQLFKKIRSKNIQVDPERLNTILPKLKNHSYYALINGYKPNFLQQNQTDIVVDGTSFNHFYACKVLEMDISSILLKYILIIEQGFRTRVAYIIAREFGTDETKYPDKKNYTNTAGTRSQALKAMKDIINNPNKSSYSYYFKSIRVPQASIPPWIVIQDMDFYKVIMLYQALPKNLRNEIRNEYIRISSSTSQENKLFADSMNFLREYRNIFAHSKRNFKEKIPYSLDEKILDGTLCYELKNTVSFDNRGKTKNLHACILLTFSYLQDPFIMVRMVSDLLNLFVNDFYVNDFFDLTGQPIFNGKTLYDILDIPLSLLDDLRTLIPMPIDELNDYYS